MNVPSSTVMFSSIECQCGGIMYPSGIFARTTNGSGLLISPASTAASSQRQIENAVVPIRIATRFVDEQQIRDTCSDRGQVVDDEHARKWMPRGDVPPNVARHRAPVVR